MAAARGCFRFSDVHVRLWSFGRFWCNLLFWRVASLKQPSPKFAFGDTPCRTLGIHSLSDVDCWQFAAVNLCENRFVIAGQRFGCVLDTVVFLIDHFFTPDVLDCFFAAGNIWGDIIEKTTKQIVTPKLPQGVKKPCENIAQQGWGKLG